MFGADVKTLNGKNLIICNTGCKKAEDDLKELFLETAVNIVNVNIDEHDKLMLLTLGLPHALNLVFGDLICNSGIDYNKIMNFGGTTFLNQINTTRDVFDENPYLYYWIQFLNPAKNDLYNSFNASVGKLALLSNNKDHHDFVDFMSTVNEYFQGEDI